MQGFQAISIQRMTLLYPKERLLDKREPDLADIGEASIIGTLITPSKERMTARLKHFYPN